MVKIKMKPINVSNTTLSLKGVRRHRKFDAKQSERHDYGTEVCDVCDKVFTKYHWITKSCSEECKREKKKAYQHKYDRKYREENREKIKANYEENREKIAVRSRKSYEENSKDPEWVEKINARQRKYYAKKKQEEE